MNTQTGELVKEDRETTTKRLKDLNKILQFFLDNLDLACQ